MKKLLRNAILLVAAIIFFCNSSFSQTPAYTLTVSNFNRIATDSMTFDIYILHTNPETGIFNYALGQYFFNFNPDIANGGTLTYRIIGSDFPQNAQPRNPTISGSQLRLQTNATLGGNGPTISSVSPGTLVVRMSLRTTASSFTAGQNLNLMWRNSPEGNPFTKIFSYIAGINTDITNSANHFIDDQVSINQISSIVPSEFKLSQNYPNPFNPTTNLEFGIPASRGESKLGFVTLKIYDLRGKEVAVLVNENLNPGTYKYEFDGSNLSSGIYFYRLVVSSSNPIQANDFVETKRMILVK